MFPSWSAIFGFVIGAVVGSFLNMAIYRLPRRLSFVNPSKSFCPKCKHPLEAIDLFPLLSWASTGGKCRYCKEPVSVRYFLVELLTGSLFAGLWFQLLVSAYAPVTYGFYALAMSGLIAASFIDLELYIIPDELNAYLLVVAIAFRIVDHSLIEGLKGGLMGWGLLWGIALLGRLAFRKDAMGHGDIKLMRGVGVLLGTSLVVADLGMAVLVGLVAGLTLIGVAMLKKSSPSEQDNSEEPQSFAPPESIGSLLKFGAWYLLCLDVIALPFPGMYSLIGEKADTEAIDESWQPSSTTIPFGPYLAVGAMVCMLFSRSISTGMETWWNSSTGSKTSAQPLGSKQERFAEKFPSDLCGKVCCVVGVERCWFLGNRFGTVAQAANSRTLGLPNVPPKDSPGLRATGKMAALQERFILVNLQCFAACAKLDNWNIDRIWAVSSEGEFGRICS